MKTEEEEEEEEEEEGEEEGEMRAVGFVTRLRSPSGDSGLPSSPRDEEEEEMLTEMQQQQLEEQQLEQQQQTPELLIDDEIMRLIMQEQLSEDQRSTVGQTLGDVVIETDWTLLDISTNAPTAVAVEDARAIGEEDFNYTGLQSMDTA